MPLKEHLLRGHSARMLLMGCFSVYVCQDAFKFSLRVCVFVGVQFFVSMCSIDCVCSGRRYRVDVVNTGSCIRLHRRMRACALARMRACAHACTCVCIRSIALLRAFDLRRAFACLSVCVFFDGSIMMFSARRTHVQTDTSRGAHV